LILASAGLRDPHYRYEDDIFEPAVRSLTELRQKQRRHPQTERLNQENLLKLGKVHGLPLYAKDIENNCGEHALSDMTVFARLSQIQLETKVFFEEVNVISRGIMKTNKDEAHWKDPAVMVSYTMQEINRHRNRIKGERDQLEAVLKAKKHAREAGKVRRASLGRVEDLYSLLKGTRGRQKLRMSGRRRRSLNLREQRVEKHATECDARDRDLLKRSKQGALQSNEVARDSMGLPTDAKSPFTKDKLVNNEEMFSSKAGIDSYCKFLKSYRVGYMVSALRDDGEICFVTH